MKKLFFLFFLFFFFASCQKEKNTLILTGSPDDTEFTANLLEDLDLTTEQNVNPKKKQRNLYVVSAVDGPMPQTLAAVMAIKGDSHGNDAILMIRTAMQPDPELQELVELEMRDLLESNEVPNADGIPFFKDNDPDLEILLNGF